MFKKLMAKLKSMASSGDSFDPSLFDDPVAEKTDWGPAKGGGSSFGTHKLVAVNPERVEFRATVGAKLFYLLFLLVGLAVIIGFSASEISSGKFGLNASTAFSLLFGSAFSLVGGLMLYFGTAPIVFDRRKGWFWKGRKSPDRVFDKSSIKHFAEFDQIHALQLISECCSGDKRSYYSYEINIVLEDGRRINVVDHGNEARIREDAQTLAEFLDRPVWDAI